jgi:hypothetical protein
MHYPSRAWLQTDERVPYILVETELPLAPKQAISLLEAKYQRVQDVYNLAAFSLDETCTTVFTIDSCGRSAFVLLAPQSQACDRNSTDSIDLEARLKVLVRNTDSALGIKEGDRGILLRSWKMEISTILGSH